MDFYASIKTYCKAHWKERVRSNRTEKRDYYCAYDRARANRPDRVQGREEYRKTEAYQIAHSKANKKWRAESPHKRRANEALRRAVLAGHVLPMPCIVCGKDAEAHHPDYSQPLYVVWLCDKHHKEVHKATRELARQGVL